MATRPDFNTGVLPKRLRKTFENRSFGVCRSCGLAQDYLRFSRDDLTEYCRVLESKDLATSEEAFHSYPIPDDYIKRWNNSYVDKRFTKHTSFFEKNKISYPKRVLFIRPTFGGLADLYAKTFGSTISVIDLSKVATRHMKENFPDFRLLEGNIHGYFSGDFLKTGPYDAIVCTHTLIHSFDVNECLSLISEMLTPNGYAIFCSEVNVKPWNPFHTIYPNEGDLTTILKQHFSEVKRIDDCESTSEKSIVENTNKHDSPDFFSQGALS